jgi:hypothetical protein
LWFAPDSVDQLAGVLVRLAGEEAALRARAAPFAGTLPDGGWDEAGRLYIQAFRDQMMVASMYQSYAG